MPERAVDGRWSVTTTQIAGATYCYFGPLQRIPKALRAKDVSSGLDGCLFGFAPLSTRVGALVLATLPRFH